MVKPEKFFIAFFITLVAVMYLSPMLLNLELSIATALIGFIGGFLLSVEVIGDERVEAIDGFLVRNVDLLEEYLTELATLYLLIKRKSSDTEDNSNNSEKERREIALWYIFSLIDLLGLLWFIKYGAQLIFGVPIRQQFPFWQLWFERNSAMANSVQI